MKKNSGRLIQDTCKQLKLDELNTRFSKALNETNLAELRQIIIDNEIVCLYQYTKLDRGKAV